MDQRARQVRDDARHASRRELFKVKRRRRAPATASRQNMKAERSTQSGFSLIELMIALMVMLVVSALASQLAVSSFRIRGREDKRSEALADARRALNMM